MDGLGAFNLNLLLALHTVLETRSVTGAATRLGITQSAMSHSLRQLRDLFDDPLLVRAGRKMVPTPRAEALAPQLKRALLGLEDVVGQRGGFDAERFRGRFTLATQDGVVAHIAAPLFQRVRALAPAAEIQIMRPPDDLAAALEDGRIDLATAPPTNVPAGLVQSVVDGTSAGWSVIGCAEHADASLDLDAFCARPHAVMSLSGHGPSFVDHALSRLGRDRTIRVRMPYLLALPHAILGTDLISVVVTPVAQTFAARLPLRLFPCPVPLPAAPMTLLWHARFDADPRHQWLRERVREAMQEGGRRARDPKPTAPPR